MIYTDLSRTMGCGGCASLRWRRSAGGNELQLKAHKHRSGTNQSAAGPRSHSNHNTLLTRGLLFENKRVFNQISLIVLSLR